jgi:hypothetical protein
MVSYVKSALMRPQPQVLFGTSVPGTPPHSCLSGLSNPVIALTALIEFDEKWGDGDAIAVYRDRLAAIDRHE